MAVPNENIDLFKQPQITFDQLKMITNVGFLFLEVNFQQLKQLDLPFLKSTIDKLNVNTPFTTLKLLIKCLNYKLKQIQQEDKTKMSIEQGNLETNLELAIKILELQLEQMVVIEMAITSWANQNLVDQTTSAN